VDPTELRWCKSSHSMGNGGNCVEVAATGRAVFVRDSKDPDGSVLRCGGWQWQAFVTALGGGLPDAPAGRATTMGGVEASRSPGQPWPMPAKGCTGQAGHFYTPPGTADGAGIALS